MKGWATLGTGHTVELASPGARLGARILDILVMVAAFIFLAIVVWIGWSSGPDAGNREAGLNAVVTVPLVIAATGIAYEVSMIALKGQTLGKMATNVKVVRADNGGRIGWGKSIGRWIIPVVLLFIPFIGWILAVLVYVSLTWDRTRQGWHDKVAGTLVIKT